MLHELLLALNGHPGSIFALDAGSKCIRVVHDLPFLHPGETTLLARLCKLATLYLNISNFVRFHRPTPIGSSSAVSGSTVPGLYLRAFCQGLDDVLEPYRKDLLGLERQLLADPYLTAEHVHCSLVRYELQFPALANMLDTISAQNIVGCSLLELLYKATSCGMPDVKEAFNGILHMCRGVLYKQLTAWMLHGLLIDQFSEFFIHKVKVDVRSLDQPPVDEDTELGGVTGRQLDYMLKLSSMSPVESEVYETYALRVEQLPSYLPVRAAEKMLFIGESVHMFETHKNRSRDTVSILEDKVDEFSKMISNLSRQTTFDLMSFEEVIDKIRTYVAERLWHLVVEQADLMSSLRMMKDFYLLGRGELFLEFIDLAQGQLRVPPTRNTTHDVNLSLQKAARNILLDNDSLMRHFSFVLDAKHGKDPGQKQVGHDSFNAGGAVAPGGRKESGWNCLRMMYTVDWPLHIFFTPSVVVRYNTLFTFLLYVKRIQLELQQCWALQMHRRHLRCIDSSGSSKWWLRNHMAFLVDNLQYYLQVDVIESQFSVLLARIDATHDFEAIRFAHDQFLSSLLSQSFLHMKQISHCLGEILELCHTFCGLMSYSDVILSAQELQQVDDITKGFQRQSSLLFKVLSSVRSHQASPHLAQLLLRIDFNRYFTTSSHQISVAPRSDGSQSVSDCVSDSVGASAIH